LQSRPIIELRNVSKVFTLRLNRADNLKVRFLGLFNRNYREQRRQFWALREVNLEVYEGETLGIIGPNGSGKSTLLRIIARILAPSQGMVKVQGQVAALIELGVGFHPELTGRENIYLNTSLYGLSKKETDKIYEEIVEFSELAEFIDQPLKNYSSGMYMRLGFSIAVQLEPDILLLDEILAVGDRGFQAKCLEKIDEIKERGHTIIFVSHNLKAIGDICDRVCLLNEGRMIKEGPPEEVLTYYREKIFHKTTPQWLPGER